MIFGRLTGKFPVGRFLKTVDIQYALLYNQYIINIIKVKMFTGEVIAMTFQNMFERTLRLRARLYSSFLLQFIFSLLINFWLGIPAAVFYALYRNGIWPLWPTWVALGAWVVIVLLGLIFIRLMFRLAKAEQNSEHVVKPNKNPYSVKLEYPEPGSVPDVSAEPENK